MTRPVALHIDVQMTRRKRWHFVVDHRGDTIYAANNMSECLDFILESEVRGLTLQTRSKTLWIELVDVPARGE